MKTLFDEIDSDLYNEKDLPDVGEETENDLEIDYLNRIHDVVTWSTDWTIESIVNQLKRSNIDLSPKFQRRDAWNPQKKSRLIESIIYGLPIPQIVLAEDKINRGKFIIVDGKQRLLTLFKFCIEQPDEESFCLIGLKNEDLNGLSYTSLEDKFPELFNNFINQSIRSVILKNWPTESFLYTIFYRLNTGTLGLSPQELRQALRPGPFMEFIGDFSQNNKELKNILKLEKPDYRMRDMDLAIRFFAYKNNINSYSGNYKKFLDDACDSFNKNWHSIESKIISQSEQFSEAIKFSIKVMGQDNVFRKWKDDNFESRFNRAVFDIMMYYFSETSIRNSLEVESEKVKEQFIKLCKENQRFQKSVSSNTSNMVETSTRFIFWAEALNQILPGIVKAPNQLLSYFNTL